MSRLQEQIGQIGEKFFNYMCSTSEITATEPGLDKYGWDFFIEFKTKQQSYIPIDLQNNNIQAKVQIKTFDKNKGYVQIKLSKMFDLVKFTLPSFICFIDLNGQNEPANIYLVHIDEIIIRKVLKAIRKKQFNQKNFTKTMITIKYNKKHIIQKPYKLDEEVLKYIPSSIDNYVTNKKKIRETIGYDELPLNMTMEFDSTIIKDYLVNPLNHLEVPSIPVKIHSIMDTRFNIPLPHYTSITKELINSENVKMQFNPINKGDIYLHFKKNKFSKPLIYKMQLLDSLLNQFIPKKERIYFLKDNFSTWQISRNTINHKFTLTFTYKIDDTKTHNLKELFHSLKLINFININRNKEIYLDKFINEKKFFL